MALDVGLSPINEGEGSMGQATTDTKLIPLEVLLGNPEKAQPQISPDGKRMAYIAPVDGVLNVWVGDVGKDNYAPVTKDTDRGIRGYAWAYNNKHLVYIQDQGGDENWRVYSVDLDTGDISDLTPFENVQARIQSINKDFPDDLLIALNKDNAALHDVYHCDLNTGELKKIAENTSGFLAWVVDREMKVRGAVSMSMDGGMVIQVRDTEDGEFRPLLEVGPDDMLTTGPVGFTADGKGMYLLNSTGRNTGQLTKMDIATGAEEVIAADPECDVTGAIVHPDTREIQAVSFLRDRIDWQILDNSIQADFDAIAALQSGDFAVTDRDVADKTWLVGFTLDDGPVKYYSLDRDTKEATFLFDHRPDLNDYSLVKMEPFAIKARDGLTLHGYITFPPGERKNLPTVLNVHGGPWGRDSWGFNPESQWFANRGYLSIQVNFRGSTGYGKEFVNAGDKEWGAKMHDDLLDTVNWAIEQGYSDPAKVAIFGGSYGGYAALVGATFTPDVFACAVDIVGPSNLKTLIETLPPYWQPQIIMFHNRVGNPETEEDFLWSRSPLSKVDNIKIPMLIAHGANDPRVKLSETEQIVDAMKAKGIEHQLMVFEDEGHGFAKPENRLKFYDVAEKFLAKHLGGRSAE